MNANTVSSHKKSPFVQETQAAERRKALQPSRVLVPLTRHYSNRPSVCVVFLGEPPKDKEYQQLMSLYQAEAARNFCDFSALVIKDDGVDTRRLLADNAPGPTFLVRLAGRPPATVDEQVLGCCQPGWESYPRWGKNPMDVTHRYAPGALLTLATYVSGCLERERPRQLNDNWQAEVRTSPANLTKTQIIERDILLEPRFPPEARLHVLPQSHLPLPEPLSLSVQHLERHPVPGPDTQVNDLTAVQTHTLHTLSSDASKPGQADTTTLACLAAWLPLSAEVQASPVWEILEKSRKADDVFTFFSTLRSADIEGTGEVGLLVGQVATALAQNPSFMKALCSMAHRVACLGTCSNPRRWFHLQEVLILHEAQQTELNPQSALRVAHQLFRRQTIFQLADEKGDLQTHLAYVHKLFKDDNSDPNKSFDLGGNKPDASHCREGLSRLTEEDITHACKKLQRITRGEFIAVLANWTPWRKALARHSTEWTKVEKLLERMASPRHAAAVKTEARRAMERDGIPIDDHEMYQASYLPIADRTVTDELWRVLTVDMLEDLDT